jgi:hypothetical protein
MKNRRPVSIRPENVRVHLKVYTVCKTLWSWQAYDVLKCQHGTEIILNMQRR